MFTRHRRHEFRHSYIYVDERNEKIDAIRRRAAEELNIEGAPYRASRLRGFLTHRTYKHRISTAAAVISIMICVLLWFLLIY